ncbi:MAG: fibronectin type III domain-containing protein [Acutalibacteraceae bacterium]
MKKTSRILAAILSVVLLCSAFALPSFAATAPAQVKNVKIIETDEDEIDLKWSKVSSATGYQVYLKRASGDYHKVLTTKKTSADIEHLISSQTYYVKVCAYKTSGGKTTYGAFSSAVKTSTEPDEVKNLSIKSVSSTKAKLSWSAVTGAEGYRVYKYNTTKKAWERIKELTATSLTVTVSSKGGEKFKVRAFAKVDGKYYFGDYSSVAVNGLNVISYAKAKTIALGRAGVKASSVKEYSAKLEKESGIYIYEVEFTSGKYEYEVEINAKTGKVIGYEKDYR